VLSILLISTYIRGGKTDVITKFDIVKNGSPLIRVKIIAGNAHA
jgi:hypothetical protein